jgi:hypothetical protein
MSQWLFKNDFEYSGVGSTSSQNSLKMVTLISLLWIHQIQSFDVPDLNDSKFM